jgi:hypothetical protein
MTEVSHIFSDNIFNTEECRSPVMLPCVVLVRTDVSEELMAYYVTVFLRSVLRLLVIAIVVSNSLILVTLMMEKISSSETSVLTRATLRNIPGNGILHSYHSENLKSYMVNIVYKETVWINE